MPTPVPKRVRIRREALRAAGLCRVQLWVPETRRPGFAQDCRRQSRLAVATDAAYVGLERFSMQPLCDLLGSETQ